MFTYRHLLIFLFAILLVIISIRSASPPPFRQGVIPDTSFSYKRAFTHLKQISRQPHSTGSEGNKLVREYIVSVCRQLGLVVEIQNTTSINSGSNKIYAANIYNIIARKKGVQNSRSVLLMAHYDSETNTGGAGDDGAGVAAMLETAAALQKLNPLRNNILLLFTDGEEMGLLGAKAFVNENNLFKEIGLVINFEGRGNAGPSNMFEVNAQNGWAINEYAKSAAHPFANSLGYEIYKKLPNSTDYTLFKDAGITGLNNAYIDGFVNYHSPNDNLQNMDLRSLQHHGENMLSLTKHFGNLNITDTKAADVSYFNFIGYWFIHYPASWNIVFVILVNLLFVAFIITGFMKKRIRAGGFIISTILFPVVLGIIYFLAKALLKKILVFYPLYSHFDENNSYNSGWYFLTMTALAITVFTFIYWLAAKKINSHSLLSGILFIAVVLMNFMQYSIPSASYLLFLPLLFILIIHLYILSKNLYDKNLSFNWGMLHLLSVVPAIFLLSTTVYFTFIAFALGANMPFVVIGVGLLSGLLLPVFYPVLKYQKLLIPLCALVCFLFALVAGHFSSGYSEKNPLQSSLYYVFDADAAKATWRSDFLITDKWTAPFFKSNLSPKPNRLPNNLINDAPAISLPAPRSVIKTDTVINERRIIEIHFAAVRENVIWIDIAIAEASNVNVLSINGKSSTTDKKTSCRMITYRGISTSGIDIVFEMEPGKKIDLLATDGSIGLPTIIGFNTNYPKDIIPTQGTVSNTTQVSKQYIF